MQPVQLADIEMAARVLLALPEAARPTMAAVLCQQASVAGVQRAETGTVHSLYGNGTLMSAASRHAAAGRPVFCTRDYLGCMADVIRALGHYGDQNL